MKVLGFKLEIMSSARGFHTHRIEVEQPFQTMEPFIGLYVKAQKLELYTGGMSDYHIFLPFHILRARQHLKLFFRSG